MRPLPGVVQNVNLSWPLEWESIDGAVPFHVPLFGFQLLSPRLVPLVDAAGHAVRRRLTVSNRGCEPKYRGSDHGNQSGASAAGTLKRGYLFSAGPVFGNCIAVVTAVISCDSSHGLAGPITGRYRVVVRPLVLFARGLSCHQQKLEADHVR